MISNDKRIRIIIGHYGSGKSEFAMNYVTKLREEIDGKIALSDLDVVNANREQTQTANQVIDHIKSIENASGLKVTGLVNNTHLIRATTVEDILRGQELVTQVSNLCNIPIKYVACLESIVDELPKDLEGEIFPIKLYMREDWM